jgi:hypothetical protein
VQAPVTVFAALGARPQEEAAAQAFVQEPTPFSSSAGK